MKQVLLDFYSAVFLSMTMSVLSDQILIKEKY